MPMPRPNTFPAPTGSRTVSSGPPTPNFPLVQLDFDKRRETSESRKERNICRCETPLVTGFVSQRTATVRPSLSGQSLHRSPSHGHGHLLPSHPSNDLETIVEDFLLSCKARGLSPATLSRGYGYQLHRVFLPWCATNGITAVGELDRRTLDRFTSSLHDEEVRPGRKLSTVSIHTDSRTLGQFLTWCAQEGETVTGKPQLPPLPRRVVDVLTRDDIDAMEAAVPYERDKLIFRLLADTGMRVGELCGLEPDDIIRVDRRAFLKVGGKGSHERLVPVSPTLVRRIERHLRGRPRYTSSPKLFLGLRRGAHGDFGALTPSGVLTLVHSAGERAGVKKRVHPHLFRHSFATEALRQQMNAVQLARILGHNSLRMIERTYSPIQCRRCLRRRDPHARQRRPTWEVTSDRSEALRVQVRIAPSQLAAFRRGSSTSRLRRHKRLGS